MTTNLFRYAAVALAIGSLLAGAALAQEPAAPPAQTQPKKNVRKAIPWKQFEYTCEGGAKLTAYLRGDLAKIRFKDQAYLMKQTMSADGNRYSDGKVVWWGKGNGGFLQEDTPDGNGKMIVKDCKLDKPLNDGSDAGTVTGTVSYLQRMALPPDAEIQVQLLDVTYATARVITETKMTLGERQVPVPFELRFDTAKIDPHRKDSILARILVDGNARFMENLPYRIMDDSGYPLHVQMILKKVPGAVEGSGRGFLRG
jgi:putative lipoprotein